MFAVAPDAPTDLTRTAATADSITLTWKHSGSSISYILTHNERDATPLTEIKNIGGSPHTVSNLKVATFYVFSMVAVYDTVGNSISSDSLETSTGELCIIDNLCYMKGDAVEHTSRMLV